MSLHGLLSVTIGVPNVEETAAYYTEFGLASQAGGWFARGTQASSCGSGGPRRGPRAVRLGTAAAFLPAPEDLAAMMTGAHSAC